MERITSYSTLQATAAGMAKGATNTNITDSLPLFIQLCEAELNDELLLKNMEQEDALTATINQNYIALPSGFVSPIALWLVISDERVLLNPALPQELQYSPSATQPQYWAIDGANIRFDCLAGSAYAVKFRYIKASNLSVSNTTNYLLLKRPDVYLYGTLRQVALYQEDDVNLSKWDRMYQAAKKALKAAENRNRAVVPLRFETPATGSRANIYRGD